MISFIIPCFNGKEALRNTLKSLAWQNQSVPFEVILIDNNSTRDNLDDLYCSFMEHLQIYLIKQPELKTTYALCKARNLGIAVSRYKWIATLDSDIILPPDYVSNAAEYLKNKSNILLCGKRVFILREDIEPLNIEKLDDATPIASSSNYNQIVDRRLSYLNQIESTPHPWAFFHGCNTIFEKDKALEAGGFDEIYDGQWGYEDIDFAYRLIKKVGVQPVYREDLFVYHQEEEVAGQLNRFDKSSNPNWRLICQRIDGFESFKSVQYASIDATIKVSG